MNTNKNYKDSVFTKLFSNKKELLNLYNAIKDTNYNINDTDINIVTLENILFMDRKNDLCFTINDKLVVLIEHQSSINNNMPLRFLFYITREYEKILDDKNIYKSNLIKIPTPEFIVLYNGKNEYPKSNKLYLSDAFYYKDNLNLELVVDVININYDVHNIILDKSNTLNGYSYFVYLVREYQKQFKTKIEKSDLLEYSIKKAIETCIEKNILNDFLKSNGSEVINMLSVEFNLDVAKEVWKEEAFQDGFENGIKQGIEQGILKQIEMLKGLNFDNSKIITEIQKYYSLSADEIEKLL